MNSQYPQVMKRESSPTPSSSASEMSDSSSSSTSSSSSSSSTLEPEQAAMDARKQSIREAKKSAVLSKYEPPKGMKITSTGKRKSAFDYDRMVANPELELWAVRIPEGIKARHLDGITLQLPQDESLDSLNSVGHFTAKKNDYEIRVVRPAEDGKKRRIKGRHPPEEMVDAHEIQALVPLLPRNSSENTWLQAPRGIVRNLVVTRAVPESVLSHLPSLSSSLFHNQPSPVPGAILTSEELLDDEIVAAKKVKRDQPAGLKPRLVLAGMGAQGGLGQFDNKPVKSELKDEKGSEMNNQQGNVGQYHMEGIQTLSDKIKPESDHSLAELNGDHESRKQKKERRKEKKEKKAKEIKDKAKDVKIKAKDD